MWDEEWQPGQRAKVTVAVVVTLLLLVTLVLCCATLGPIGEMLQLRLPPL